MSFHVVLHWRNCAVVRVCLFAATTLLAIAGCLHRWGMLQPTQVGRLLGLSSRLIETASRAWRSCQQSQGGHQ